MTNKQKSDLQKAIDNFGEAYVAMCVEFVKGMKPLLEKMKEVRDAGGLDPFKDPEVRLVEQSAIPAAYYMRDSVQEAIKAEVIRDIKAGQTCPPGFELIKSEEESTDGETEKISSSENDINDGGDGPESPGDGENDGSQNSGGGEDHPGDTAQDPNDSGKGPKTRGKK